MSTLRIRIDCRAEKTQIVANAIAILERQLQERGGVEVGADAALTIRLGIHPGMGTESYAIEDHVSGVAVIGNDERGLLYGIGRFLRGCRFSETGVEFPAWRGVSVPVKPVRGMYFATHFHNFYHDAPITLVERYVEELALWGCNALSVWFDMHHYQGMDDPAAVAMIERLRAILRAAERVGMGLGLITLANEAFADSPAELRADWRKGQNGYHRTPEGHYHVEICPSLPGGMEMILDCRRQVLQAFADLPIRYVWIWPYDQGGCTCAECAPWGSNGFLRVAEAEARIVKNFFPAAEIVFSTWFFDHFVDGEWDGIAAEFSRKRPEWIDWILIDGFGKFPEYPLQHGVPGAYPVLGFPEISMQNMLPWGGFGANPRPQHWQAHWDKMKSIIAGSFPYSEGIFEDMNKIFEIQLGWNPERTVVDIVREYAASEFAPEAADDVLGVVQRLEEALNHNLKNKLVVKLWRHVDFGKPRPEMEGAGLYVLPKATAAEAAATFAKVEEIDAKLSAHARKSWRWRILWLRAALDAELSASGGSVTDASEAYFSELVEIYHAQKAEIMVLPPSLQAMTCIYPKLINEDADHV